MELRKLVQQAGLSEKILDDPLFMRVLPLVCVPRAFNLFLWADLVEQFALEHKPDSMLDYRKWVQKLNEFHPGLIEWQNRKLHPGFYIKEDIRILFLMSMDKELFESINSFLVSLYSESASKSSGDDELVFQIEASYHRIILTLPNSDIGQEFKLKLLQHIVKLGEE